MTNISHSQSIDEAGQAQAQSYRRFAAKWMRAVGTAEGISFLLLLFVAMPVKYIGDNPELVHWLGPVHGGLFVLYVASALAVARVLNWRWTHVMLAFIASVFPFGPFVFESYLRREEKTVA